MRANDPPPLQRGDALFLDFDGTLAEIAPRPDLVRVAPELVADLMAVQRELDGAVAVISGRRLADVDRYLHPLVALGAGLHGAELRTPDGVSLADEHVDQVRAATAQLHADLDGFDGVLVEDKGLSVAVHYRNAPQQEGRCRALAAATALSHGLQLLQGKMVFELRGAGLHKGAALGALAALDVFHRRRPVFVGDDVTDEDGFDAAEARGGLSVKVGEGATRARHHLRDVAAVHAWLQRSRRALATQAAA